MRAIADTRYSFAPQFLEAAAIFAQLAADMENKAGKTAAERDRVIHRGYVVSTIIQCVAALETELYEVTTHGPGSHLGSAEVDIEAREFLKPCVEMINRQRGILPGYQIVLHMLRKTKMNKSGGGYQHAKLLITLRNELVHYKSKWASEMSAAEWQKKLHDLVQPKPPFVHEDSSFFPDMCLSAACANWAVRTAVRFLDDFYRCLDVGSPLEPYKSRLALQ